MGNASWITLGLLAALGAAGVTVFGRLGLNDVNPTLATTLRSLIMAAVMVAVSLATGQLQTLWSGRSHLDGRAWLFIVLAGVAGAVSWLAYFAALRTGPAGGVAALDRLSIVLIMVFGALLLGEQYSWRGWLGLLLLLAGVYLVATGKRPA